MKVVFTRDRNPGFFQSAISHFEKSPWTHCALDTGLRLPSKEPIGLHSQWNQGLVMMPLSIIIGSKHTDVYELPFEPDWLLILQAMAKFKDGVLNYGFAKVAGHVLRALSIKEPSWLVKRYESQLYCSSLIALIAQKHGQLLDLDLTRTGPGTLWRALQNESVATKSNLIL